VASIPKIVSIPVKWVSKKIIHHSLLRFPGGAKADALACTYCPELCRFSCSPSVVSGNDAVTPSNKMGLLYKEREWPDQFQDVSQGVALWPIYDCTGCGRCTHYCLHGVPVAETLFRARASHPYVPAEELSRSFLSEEMDPWGELNEEVGQKDRADQLFAAEVARHPAHVVIEVDEPKTVHYLGYRGVSTALSWQSVLMAPSSDPIWSRIQERLNGKRWLIVESSWLNRRLGRSDQVLQWVERARGLGIDLITPHQTGTDCVDTGGEGAYSWLFREQAAQMARDFWQRDAHRADSLLCFSPRIASHFQNVFLSDSSVVSPPGTNRFCGGVPAEILSLLELAKHE